MKPAHTSQTILIVDDQPAIQNLFKTLLEEEGYHCVLASNGIEALAILENIACSLLFSDISMPNMNGIELLTQVQTLYPDMAVIMMSGETTRQKAIDCLHLGAFGYMTKPINLDEILINVSNGLHRRDLEMANRQYRQELEKQVAKKTEDLELACEESMNILSKAAEFRDNETAQHNTRMGLYCELLAKKIGLTDTHCKLIRKASPLHDVGKIGIPDEVLLKPSRLTDEEMTVIKTHCEIGYRILSEAESDAFQLGATIAHSHHEKFDGSGYPQGIKGQEIPLEGRIAAICDVFDALTSKRIYKEAMNINTALLIMKKERGHHFDPELFDSFLYHIKDILQIKSAHIDCNLNKMELSAAA